MTKTTEYITVPMDLKALEAREISGHASIFGNVDLGGDIVLPGAFKRSLAEHRTAGTMPQMFWMHSMDQVPGRWTDIHEDDKGLFVKGELAKTQLGDEMRTLVGMKAVRGLSIGYVPTDVDYDDDGNRLLKAVDLWENSLVSLAMNPLARIEAAKSRLSATGEYVPRKLELEQTLRKAGFSKATAMRMVYLFHQDTRKAAPGDDDEADELLKTLSDHTARLELAALKF